MNVVLVETVWVLDSVFELGHSDLARGVEMLLNPAVVKKRQVD